MKNNRWMRKAAWLLAVTTAAGILGGCGGSGSSAGGTTAASESTAAESAAEETTAAVTTAAEAASEAPSGESVKLLVAAAASLKNAYEEKLIPMFEEANTGITVEGVYDSSGKLQTQIEEGLEADVFMSAATAQMTALDEEGLIASESIVNLLENKIVLIVPAGGEEGYSAFEDIANAQTIALGDPASVPAGQYAEEALTSLGLWDGIQDKVSFGTNVTEVLNQVAAGSADAGVVYATDAASMPDQVTVIAEAPEGSLAEPVIYPVAAVKAGAHAQEAQAFVDFLGSEEAMAVFEEYGFSQGTK